MELCSRGFWCAVLLCLAVAPAAESFSPRLSSLVLQPRAPSSSRVVVGAKAAAAAAADGATAAAAADDDDDDGDATPELGRKHFIRNIVEADLASGKHAGLVTRFPPEPNGYLHIGHAKSICLNFGLAKEYGGVCHMRFDDTNPVKEDMEYVESILRDVTWLMGEGGGGGDPEAAGAAGAAGGAAVPWDGPVRHTSDYFDLIFACAQHLIKTGKAYIDFLSAEEMRAYRGTLTEPGRPSPDRLADRSVAETLALFERMAAGDFEEGAAPVLRAKIDMAAPNVNLRDPVLYRMRKDAVHPLTGDTWKVYPMYDFAHAVSDAVEGITHSLCTLEFADHRPLYDWFLDGLKGVPGLLDVPQVSRGGDPEVDAHPPPPAGERPRQMEFSRLNLQYTVLSKRRLIHLVTGGHVQGWDDPRMPTVAGLRRRGYPPQAIRLFCERVGISKADNNIDMGVLEDCARLCLDESAPRALAVLDPLKVTITTWPEDGSVETFTVPSHPRHAAAGEEQGAGGSGDPWLSQPRQVPLSREVWIDKSDFLEAATPGFNRLVPGGRVRLKYAYVVTCDEVVYGGADGKEVVELKVSHLPETRAGAKDVTPLSDGSQPPKAGIIGWVSAAHAVDAEVRLYDRLFGAAEPGAGREDKDHLGDLNPDSISVRANAKLEPSAAVLAPVSSSSSSFAPNPPAIQFERLGYFAHDCEAAAAGAASSSTGQEEGASPVVVLNRVVTLRDSWAAAGAGAAATGGGKVTKKGKTPNAGAAEGKGGQGGSRNAAAADPRYPYSDLKASAQAKVADEVRVELRVGEVLAAAPHPDPAAAGTLLVSTVDCGDAAGPRTIVSRVAAHYPNPAAQLVAKRVVVVANLKPAVMRGVESAGMLLAATAKADDGDGDVVELLEAPAGARVGARLAVAGGGPAAGGEAKAGGPPPPLPDPVLKSEGQLKAWKRFAKQLAVDEQGAATWDGRPLVVAVAAEEEGTAEADTAGDTAAAACTAPTLRNVPVG